MDEYFPLEEEIDEESPKAKKPIPNIVLYSVGAMLSFIIVTALIYFIVIKPRVQKEMVAIEEAKAAADSSQIAEGDSTAIALGDSNKVLVDSTLSIGDEEIEELPETDFLTLEDQLRILQMENARREKEIDHLWSEMLALVEKIQPDALSEEGLVSEEQNELENQLAQLKEELKIASEQLTQKEQELEKLTQAHLELKREKAVEAKKQEMQEAPSVASVKKSAKIYASMKAPNAASVLSKIDKQDAAQILTNMRERQAAKILSAMHPDLAAQICKLIDKQKK